MHRRVHGVRDRHFLEGFLALMGSLYRKVLANMRERVEEIEEVSDELARLNNSRKVVQIHQQGKFTRDAFGGLTLKGMGEGFSRQLLKFWKDWDYNSEKRLSLGGEGYGTKRSLCWPGEEGGPPPLLPSETHVRRCVNTAAIIHGVGTEGLDVIGFKPKAGGEY